MYDTLKECAKIAEEEDININLEALNILTDHVGNFLETTQMGAEIVRLIGCDKLKLLYDAYHMQLNEGKICDTLTQYIDVIGHVHIADAPGRHEPGTGEINYNNIMQHLESLKYQYRVGSELFPLQDTATAVKAIMATKPK
jgi:hydroxypyruvate isomerase